MLQRRRRRRVRTLNFKRKLETLTSSPFIRTPTTPPCETSKRMAIAGALDAVPVEIRRKLAKAKVGFDCPECGSGKVKFKRAKSKARTPDYKPGQYWQTDHSGPYPSMHGSAKYSTVFVEYMKRFTYFFETEKIDAATSSKIAGWFIS